MKKAATLLLLILISTLVLCGCSAAQKSGPDDTSEKFLKAMYTVDADNIEDYKVLMTKMDELKKNFDQETGVSDISDEVDGSLQALYKNILPLVTDKEYENIMTNRYYASEADYCTENDFTLQITDFSLDKNEPAEDENNAGYNYKVELKHVSADERAIRSRRCRGISDWLKKRIIGRFLFLPC